MPQGTIRSFDHATWSGTLLDDDLREMPYDREAFQNSGLVELRIGQRVRYELAGSGDDLKVTNLGIVSL